MPTSSPGTHVLIVGVSAYPCLPADPGANKGPPGYGFTPLSAAALTAYRVLRALLDRGPAMSAPLASCRVLLSPTAREVANEPGLGGWLHPSRRATADNVVRALEEWQEEAKAGGGASFFYFAGHGVAIQYGDVALLCEDFGDERHSRSPLQAAVSRDQIRRCLWPAGPGQVRPRVQYCLFDACRNPNEKIDDLEQCQPRGVFSIPRSATEPQEAVTLDATPAGRSAWSVPDRFTVFGRAVELSLRHGGSPADAPAVNPPWVVDGCTFHEAIRRFHTWHPDLRAFCQRPTVNSPLSRDAVLFRQSVAPRVLVQFGCRRGAHHCQARIDVQPTAAAAASHGPPVPAGLLLAGGSYGFQKCYSAPPGLPPQRVDRMVQDGLLNLDFECP